jgi:Uma2 family endonuclease
MAVVTHLGQVLTAAFGGGWHVRLQGPLALDDHSEPELDVAVVPGRALDYLAGHPTSAVLVVEVADSSLRLDRRFKAGLYARAALPEYWIVNLVDRVVEVHREPAAEPASAFGAVYRTIDVLRPGDAMTPRAASHARIEVTTLLPPG